MIVFPFSFINQPVTLDPDAAAFLSAIGNTDPTIQEAINTLVIDLKDEDIWDDLFAIYPIVGGTSTSHSYNLKDTGTYQITWNGGWTHSSNGALGNATNTFADTGVDLTTTSASLNSHSISIYNKIANLSISIDTGAIVGSFERINFYSYISFGVNSTLYDPGSEVERMTYGGGTSYTQGNYILTRVNSTSAYTYYNGTKLMQNTNSNSATALPSYNMVFGDVAQADPPATVLPSANQYAFYSLGIGLNETKASSLSTIIENFQTTLGREN